MKNVTTFDNFPTFAENGSRNMNTESAKYQIGFVEADTFPAEWCNYLFHGATKGVSDLNTAVQSIWQENINVITQSGQTPNPNSTNQLYTAIQTFINNAILSANASILAQAKLDAHPVGSLYWSSDPTNPSELFGGTWVRIKDRFIWAKGDSDTVNATGGSKTVSLAENNLPSHKHFYTPSGSVESHHHGLNNHTHSFSGTTSDMSDNNSGGFAIGLAGEQSLPRWYVAAAFGNCSSRKFSGTVTFGTKDNYEMSGDYSNTVIINVNHTHTYSGTTGGSNTNTTDAQPSFTGTRAQTEGTGSGAEVTIMNPYVVKYCWERTA
jgi:hypothetical protein